MGFFNRSSDGTGSQHANEFRRKLRRISKRDILDLTEGHLGQLGVAVLVMRQGAADQFPDAVSEALRLTEELSVMLDEVSDLA